MRHREKEVIRTAAQLGGTIDRKTIYETADYENGRMLRGVHATTRTHHR